MRPSGRIVVFLLVAVSLTLTVRTGAESPRIPDFHDGTWEVDRYLQKGLVLTVPATRGRKKTDATWGISNLYHTRAKWIGIELSPIWDKDNPVVKLWTTQESNARSLLAFGTDYVAMRKQSTWTEPFSTSYADTAVTVSTDKHGRVIGLTVRVFEVKNPKKILASQYFENPSVSRDKRLHRPRR